MLDVEKTHNQAMDLVERAFDKKRKGETDSATKLFLEALELEMQAASAFPAEEKSEPTRSVLYRSAASIAYHATDYERAEQLVARGLSGYPPIEIKEELRALQDDINFRRHIALKGAQLGKDQFQMSLDGNATGYGIIPAKLLADRIDQVKRMVYRTVERLADVPWRTAGPPRKQIGDSYSLYVSGFEAGSFGVSFTLGGPVEQLTLFPEYPPCKIEPEEVIDELLTCFELLEENELDILRERLAHRDYYEGFVGLAREMAPDGEAVKALYFVSSHNGKERVIGLRTTRKDIPPPARLLDDEDDEGDDEQAKRRETVRLEGTLKLADSLKIEGKTGLVKLEDKKHGKAHTIRVPVTQMQDVVQPYFEEYVVITGYKKGRDIYLEDIGYASEQASPTLFDFIGDSTD